MKFFITLAVVAAGISTVTMAQTDRDLGSHEHGAAVLNIALDNDSIFLELESPWNNLVGFEHAPRTEEQHALVDDALALLNQPGQLFLFNGTSCELTEISLDSTISSDEKQDDHGHDEDQDDEGQSTKDDDHGDEEHAAESDDDDHEAKEEHADDDHDAGGGDDGGDDHSDEDSDAKEEDHADDEHDTDAEDHDSEDKDHADEDHEEGDGSHSSVLAFYTFGCDELKQLSSIDVKALEIWSGFEKLQVQLVGTGGQALVELNQEQTQVDISQVQ